MIMNLNGNPLTFLNRAGKKSRKKDFQNSQKGVGNKEVAMNVCCSCFGTGTVTCFSCGGRKKHSKFKSLDGRDISTCLVCDGRGILPCRICNCRHNYTVYVYRQDFALITDWAGHRG